MYILQVLKRKWYTNSSQAYPLKSRCPTNNTKISKIKDGGSESVLSSCLWCEKIQTVSSGSMLDIVFSSSDQWHKMSSILCKLLLTFYICSRFYGGVAFFVGELVSTSFSSHDPWPGRNTTSERVWTSLAIEEFSEYLVAFVSGLLSKSMMCELSERNNQNDYNEGTSFRVSDGSVTIGNTVESMAFSSENSLKWYSITGAWDSLVGFGKMILESLRDGFFFILLIFYRALTGPRPWKICFYFVLTKCSSDKTH